MKLHEVPVGAKYLDVDSIPVVVLPGGEHIAFHARGIDSESRPYPNKSKAGEEGDVISREKFERWLTTGQPQPIGL
jgi:hypothetical protein